MGRVAGGLKDKKALFITLEGVEGSGKSSLLNFLKKILKKKGFSLKLFRDPGSTQVGEKIRQILLDKKSKISPHTELLLYLAARTQLIEEKLKKALKKYDIVICDRFYDSTVVYQGYGLGLKIAQSLALKFCWGIKPDLTIVLDTDIKKGLSRIKNKDRIEKRPLDFHQRLKKGYYKLAKKEPGRIKLIKKESLEEIFKEAEEIVEKFLKKWKKKF